MARLSAGNTNRDDLLDFLVQRLAEMRTAQLAEIDLAKATENSLRTSLAESKTEQPQAQRWNQAAKLYQDAARALCNGQLHRGASLVEQAVKEDKKAFDQLSSFVETEAQGIEEGPENRKVYNSRGPTREFYLAQNLAHTLTAKGHYNTETQNRDWSFGIL